MSEFAKEIIRFLKFNGKEYNFFHLQENDIIVLSKKELTRDQLRAVMEITKGETKKMNPTLWQRIIQINKFAEAQNGFKWRFDNLDAFSNDLMSEVGEIAELVKRKNGRGSKTKKINQFWLKMIEEIFDVYVYLVLGCESFGMTEGDFKVMANIKLEKLQNRLGVSV